MGVTFRGSRHFYPEPGIRFSTILFSEPAPLASAEVPNVAGIYAVLRFDAVWKPKPYYPVLFGDATNLAEAVEAERQRWKEPGVFIAWCPQLYGNAVTRRALRQRLSETYRLPGAEAHATLDIIPQQGESVNDRISKLENRFDQHADQLKIVMHALARFTEPLPEKPCRPIGFVTGE